ncbi:DUF2489 domain-containing protein [Isoalcanivorax indicus]|uniref:DUF2489 domain-containing protein n=1 Tax=Isoalcanivorax indicus TaxID=2202653 RepID=UPI000DBA6B31|nr:DUF2489 domain-containing protein [Isoalcanivorax indicus]
MSLTMILILVAAVIIVLLVACAIGLWRRVWQREREAMERQHQTQKDLLDQMEIVCRSLQQDQMNVTEGALRLASLLDKLTARPPQPLDLAAIHQLAEDASGLAIGGARQALPDAERRKQDRARQQLEMGQTEAVVAAAGRLLQALPAWRLHLQLAS